MSTFQFPFSFLSFPVILPFIEFQLPYGVLFTPLYIFLSKYFEEKVDIFIQIYPRMLITHLNKFFTSTRNFDFRLLRRFAKVADFRGVV